MGKYDEEYGKGQLFVIEDYVLSGLPVCARTDRQYIRPVKEVREGSPHFDTKERLLNLLAFFNPIESANIPFNSILREFVGGSIYFRTPAS